MSYPPTAPGETGSFTVIMTELLRERFERWLRREHLRMVPLRDTGPTTYVVMPTDKSHSVGPIWR